MPPFNSNWAFNSNCWEEPDIYSNYPPCVKPTGKTETHILWTDFFQLNLPAAIWLSELVSVTLLHNLKLLTPWCLNSIDPVFSLKPPLQVLFRLKSTFSSPTPQKKNALSPNGSRAHDLPEYQLDALTAELWETRGEQGHIPGSYHPLRTRG